MPMPLEECTWLSISNVWQQYQDGAITSIEAMGKIAEMSADCRAILILSEEPMERDRR
jgi:hypothetical protein